MNVGEDTPGFEKPFADVRVRRAINHAINKQEIVEYLYKGTAVAAKNPIPPSMWGYNDAIQDYEYNPEKARQLLQEAGYPNGFETTLYAMPVSRPYMFDPPKIAEAIQADLEAVGIKAKIYTVEWGTYLQETEAGKHPMCLLGWIGDNGDPDNFLYVLLDKDNAIVGSAGNVAFYRNDELHDILIKAQRTYDQEERTRLYLKAQEIIHDDAPWVPLAHAKLQMVFKKNVKGFVLHPLDRKDFRKVWIEK
jgi:peptide/nickel transport system substrate-binding protein